MRATHVACQNFSLVWSEWVELMSATMQANWVFSASGGDDKGTRTTHGGAPRRSVSVVPYPRVLVWLHQHRLDSQDAPESGSSYVRQRGLDPDSATYMLNERPTMHAVSASVSRYIL